MIIVHSVRCPKNHICPMVKKCPQQSIRQEGFAAPVVDAADCVECGLCVDTCPYGVFEQIPDSSEPLNHA